MRVRNARHFGVFQSELFKQAEYFESAFVLILVQFARECGFENRRVS